MTWWQVGFDSLPLRDTYERLSGVVDAGALVGLGEMCGGAQGWPYGIHRPGGSHDQHILKHVRTYVDIDHCATNQEKQGDAGFSLTICGIQVDRREAIVCRLA